MSIILPSEYLILRQPSGQPARILHVKDNAETVVFEGKRWPAKWMMDWLAVSSTHGHLRCFNQRRGRGGHPGSIEELYAEATR